ncbi:MAG: hypothetical protein NT154_31310 [Verrucomicrobia bacterium]|nr:hypothetical protein [Verrucomicrobiota bacterium]
MRSPLHVRRALFSAIRFSWLVLLVSCWVAPSRAAELYVRQSHWVETVLASRAALDGAGLSGPERTKAAEQVWFRVKDDFPVQWDWVLQDGGADVVQWLQSASATGLDRRSCDKALTELGDSGQALRNRRSGW